jgi:hypothetical protein
MAAKSNSGGFGNAVRDLVRSVTGSGGGDVRRAEDKAASAPSYSAFSVKGLTSSDPANVARNQAAAKMYNAKPSMITTSDRRSNAEPAAAAPAAPAVTPTPTPLPVTPPTLTPPTAPVPVGAEAPTSAVEAAAMESTKGGRASTILTGALGLLADQEAKGQLRGRRSLMGGGLIK